MVASLQACAQPFIDQVQLPQRLQELYTEILTNTAHTNVVVMPYHLAIRTRTCTRPGSWKRSAR